MADFLRIRNGNFYFRLRIPADLRNIFPDAEVLKSLRTKEVKVARLSASCLRPLVPPSLYSLTMWFH